ncbi:potassium-transporting ATPase subunit KdpC [Hartmannibacter diazotrophicus]|nr:potassium-transporting ATPase subunit KdpC [Hartmannibacter diazotrophicus]
MLSQMRPALVLLAVMTVLTGFAYPLTITGAAQALFPNQANGSLLAQGGTVIGSALLGQSFARPEYFHGRPSAVGYDAASSGATNLAPTSKALVEAVASRTRAMAAESGTVRIPVDLVTSSGSGLDPDISPESAYLQVRRIATARGLANADVHRLVDRLAQRPLFGIFGAPAVNVLGLNLALDEKAPVTGKGMGPTNGAGTDQR